MNHQPFEDWLLNNSAITQEQKRDLDSHLRTCAYCAALARTDRVLRAVKMASPASGFVTRFEIRLAAQRAVDRRRRIVGSILFTLGGLAWMIWFASPYLATFLASPATWSLHLWSWECF